MEDKKPALQFRGTKAFALIPLFFLMACTFYFMAVSYTHLDEREPPAV